MLYWLYEISQGTDLEKFFNIFRYQTFRAGFACIAAFLIVMLLGERVIRHLISMKIGQPIRTAEEVHKLHELHGAKAGTPTMGGVLMIGGVVISTLLACRWSSPYVWACLFVFCGHAILGFLDDYAKVKKKTSDGVSARFKLVLQLLIAMIACGWLYYNPGTREHISAFYIPFLKVPLMEHTPVWIALPFFAIVIIGASNAVNLTDGLDGLASGCTVSTSLTYAAFAYVGGNAISAEYLLIPFDPLLGEVAIVCLALAGSALGFLWFNAYPARVFMGDTGSLAIGGLIGIVAICCRQELALIIVGGVFVMEAGSVMLQVGSFKLRKKRIFRMAPIHHHFELGGWKETQVITRFWILSIFCALLGLATLKLR
ncbi:phospho-N-acetylmuramoyl-pentapeptide-transferase [Verrucomicrobiales bacterium]|nr:phospho-N-acetylmuramoyl-pentapeptide-transferase [Verrucomicrobiales bacterium]